MARYLTLFTFCVATAFLNAPKECLLAVTRMRSEDWLSALRAVVGSAHPPCTCRFAGPVDAALSDVGRGAQNLRRIPPFEHSGHGQVSAGERGVATLGCVIYQPGTEHVEQISDLEVTASLGIMRELCGARWVPERMLFAHAKPANLGPYRRFFQTECRFDSERTALLFPAALLKLRLPKADPKRIRDLQREAHARDDFGLVFRLRRSLRTLLLSQAASGDEVARQLSMHRRTMERHLKSEGTTFQEVLGEVRFQAACQLLDRQGC